MSRVGKKPVPIPDKTKISFAGRFQHKTGQLESTGRLKQVKRDIARVKTIRREKELNSR